GQTRDATPKGTESPAMPDLTGSVGMSPSAAAFDAEIRPGRAKKKAARTASSSLLPIEGDEKKSRTLGRYQFRKSGAGWECLQIAGKGINRKRPYLAYLSRTTYKTMQVNTSTLEELKEKLIEWADQKREEKPQRSLPF